MQLATELDARRDRLKMSKVDVAKRAGVSLPTVKRVLAGREKRPGPATLQGIGTALGVTIKLSPVLSVEEDANAFQFRKQQALSKAKRLVRMVQGTMGLEAQGVEEAVLAEMVEQTAYELLAGSPRRLWGD